MYLEQRIVKINIKNIKSYIEGNTKYIYDNIIGLEPYIKEQLEYRAYKCKDDCIINGKCIICTCPTIKKHMVTTSCNYDRFPDLMTEIEWNKYKETIIDYE